MTTPRTIDDITPDWLAGALSFRYPGVQITGLEVVNVMSGMAAKVRVRPTYIDDGRDYPETVIVKGHLNGHDLGNAFSFQLEMHAYQEVVPTAGARTPDCLFSGDGAGGPVLILEDLTPRGARFLDPTQPLEFDQAASLLRALARIHALWWAHPSLDEAVVQPWLSETGPIRQEMDAYFIDNVSSATWNRMAELPRGLAVPRSLRDQPRVQRALLRFLEYRRLGPRTLSHGDEHLSNFYVLPDGEPGLLDWQSRKEPWCVSIAYFMALVLDVMDRRVWEHTLMRIYLAELSASGGPVLAFDDAWQAYRACLIFPYTIWFTNRTTWQPEAFVTACTVRAAWAMDDLKAFDL